MKNSIIIGLLLASFAVFGQAPSDPIPPKPGEQPLDGPQTESKTPITKQTPEQALAQKNASIAQASTLAPGGLNSGRNPQASPESNFINRFQDIPINLYTGTPIINFPIYTLSEPGGASVPIGLSFNASGMKAHDVASWVGMNWTFYAGGQITRIVRGIPDEGRYTIDGSYNITARKGFFQHGLKADNDPENDSQADLYFLNINDQSYKFTFDVNRKAHFFPEADIDVSVSWNARDNTTAGYFTNWVITMPDGTKYFFDGTATESSYEMEANTAKTLLYPNFGNYIKAENIPSAYYLTKIRMPFGHETNFEYHKSYYSYFKLAEQSTTTFNCTFSNINKAINRVYIESDVLFKISNNNITVELNKDGWSYEPRYILLDDGTNYFLGNHWILNNSYPERTDIDRSENLINASRARALHKISIYDNAAPSNILEWNLKYDQQTSTGATIPFGYTAATVGNTHEKRFKLKSITEPDGNYYFFKYYSENFNLPSRFTQGVDHWGYLNGANGATNMIGEDAFRVCSNNQFSNRNASSGWSQYGTITDIIHNNGGSTVLEYENHEARNYSSIIGGSRLKKSTFIDSVSHIRNIKTYSYLQNNGQSSGFLTLKPVYHFDDNADGTINQYWVSGLYQQLLSESGRPAVGYSNVKESIVDPSANLLGYTKSDFSQPLTAPTIQQKIPYNCQITFPPNGPPVTTCDTLVKMRPYKWNPYHDNSIGSPTRIAVYNANNQILSDKSIVYGEGPLGNYTDQTAYRSFRMENQNYNFIGAYYDASKAFRASSDTTKIFSLDGTKPITTITQYIYKDEMDNAYKANYPGTHNQLVKTITTNSLGHQIESLTKYAKDFDFGNTIPPDQDAQGINQLLQKHIYSAVVESTAKQNGNIIEANYQNYYENSGLPKASYSNENLPRTNFTEAVYSGSTLIKDSNYDLKNIVNSYNSIALPISITEKYGATSKIDYDATNTLPIKTYKNFGAVDQQSTQTEYNKKIFGISKEIGTNGLEIRKEFYANGKLKQILDKDNNVLKHFTYLYRGTIDATLKTDSSKNRIITRVPRIAANDATNLTYTNCNITIQYLDGAGRTLETIGYKASPNGKSIISGATGFDEFGRVFRNYLPIESDYNDGRFVDTTAVHTKAKVFYGDNICYSQVIYENSPLSRPLKSYGVGAAFRTANKFSESNYETIDTEAGLKKITATVGENKGIIGSYASNQLFKKTSFDERGSSVIEYSDKSGNIIRRDVQSSDTEYLTTAYVYDDANRLRYVLPPNAYNTVKNQAEFTESDPVFNEMIYAYHYDGRGRVYETHTPGTGWSRVVYNRLNQPVLTQDDDEASTNTWNYAQTDGQGRTVRTGQIQTAESRATLQGYFNDYVVDNQFEERSTAGGNVAQYTNRSFPTELQSLITTQSLKTVAYYDNYDWRNGVDASTGTAANYDFQSNTLNASAYSRDNSAVGLNTGGLIKDDLNGDLLMPAVSYYDDKNRSIQSVAYTHLQARDQSDTKYNFNSDVANSKAIYRQSSKADIIRTTSHTYDHMSRPKILMYGISLYNGGAEFPMNLFNYDPIGRMKTKYIQPSATQITSTNQTGEWGIGNTWKEGTPPNLQTLAVINTGHTVNITNNANYQASSLVNNGILSMGTGSMLTLGSMPTTSRVALQTIDYSYNVRSQLRGVNLDASGNMQTGPEKLFSYKLDYHEDSRYYDGNISKQSWKSYSTLGGMGVDTRTYTYTYDRSNRVKNAIFTGKGSEAYGVSNISYDIMGNLQTMDRFGKIGTNSWGEIDKLAYTYINSGNKLQQVDDTGQNATAGGFINGNSGIDHSYTNAGKITSDLNKGITLIEYNFLDLVKKQTFSDKTVEYGYNTTGQRRMRKVTKNGQTNYTFYNGEIVYNSTDGNVENATIAEIQNAEGRFVDGQFTYGYTDQVGNLRLSYRDSVLATGGLTSIVVQENAYDVWGNQLDGLNFNLGQKDNYLISGKEQDSESGNTLLDWRDYDPSTGRMKNPDPADQFENISRYSYSSNNPVAHVDPDGRWLQYAIGAVMGGIGGWQIGKSKGAKGWDMFGYVLGGAGVGAITAGVGSSVQGAFNATTMGGHILAYGASGAVSGFVGGGLTSFIGSGNFWPGAKQGAFWGGLTGVVTGTIVGGINYSSRVNTARQSLMSAGVDPNAPISATNTDLKSFVQQNPALNTLNTQAGNPNLFVAASNNMPNGNTLSSDGLILTPGGDLAGGITNPLFKTINHTTGSIKADIYIAPKQFAKAYKLYMTVGHELHHAIDFNVGNFTRWFNTYNSGGYANNANTLAGYRSEVNAHGWSYSMAKVMHNNSNHYYNMINQYKNFLPFLAK